MNAGSAAEPAGAAAEQAQRSHVRLPTRGRGGRGRGDRMAGRAAGGSGMKLGASKLGKPEEFFDF